MNKITKIISIVSVVALVICMGGFAFWQKHIPTRIERYDSAVYLINHDNPQEVVGIKQYVFVARIIEVHDYYTEKKSRDFPDVIDYFDKPFTECRLEIIKNIKGSLIENSEISFYKGGGVNSTRTSIMLYQNDIMPEQDKYYIFMGMAHPDGTMTGGGTNGTIALEDGIDKNNLESSAIYQKYVDAYNNQIEPSYNKDFEYYAKADIHYNNGTTNAQLYEKSLKAKKERGDILDKAYDKALKSENPKLEKVLEKVLA